MPKHGLGHVSRTRGFDSTKVHESQKIIVKKDEYATRMTKTTGNFTQKPIVICAIQ